MEWDSTTKVTGISPPLHKISSKELVETLNSVVYQ